MRNITHRRSRLRSATAEGFLRCSTATLARIKANDLPKGNLLDIARAAALLAAKNAPQLIPDCHSARVDHADVQFDLLAGNGSDSRPGLRCRVFIESIDRAGPEMAALTAANVALLTAYDLLKPIETDLAIEGLRLIQQSGDSPPKAGTRSVVLVVSDVVAAGEKGDRAGPIVTALLHEYGIEVLDHVVLPCSEAPLAAALKRAHAEGARETHVRPVQKWPCTP